MQFRPIYTIALECTCIVLRRALAEACTFWVLLVSYCVYLLDIYCNSSMFLIFSVNMLMPHQTACWHIVYTIWLHCNILKHWIWSHHADITINIDSVLFINSRVLNHKSGVYCINGIELCCWWIRHWDSKWDILCRSRCQDYCHDEVWSEQTAETERPAFWRYRRQWQVNWETGKSIISVLLIGFHCHASSSTTRWPYCIVDSSVL